MWCTCNFRLTRGITIFMIVTQHQKQCLTKRPKQRDDDTKKCKDKIIRYDSFDSNYRGRGKNFRVPFLPLPCNFEFGLSRNAHSRRFCEHVIDKNAPHRSRGTCGSKRTRNDHKQEWVVEFPASSFSRKHRCSHCQLAKPHGAGAWGRQFPFEKVNCLALFLFALPAANT